MSARGARSPLDAACRRLGLLRHEGLCRAACHASPFLLRVDIPLAASEAPLVPKGTVVPKGTLVPKGTVVLAFPASPLHLGGAAPTDQTPDQLDVEDWLPARHDFEVAVDDALSHNKSSQNVSGDAVRMVLHSPGLLRAAWSLALENGRRRNAGLSSAAIMWSTVACADVCTDSATAMTESTRTKCEGELAELRRAVSSALTAVWRRLSDRFVAPPVRDFEAMALTLRSQIVAMASGTVESDGGPAMSLAEGDVSPLTVSRHATSPSRLVLNDEAAEWCAYPLLARFHSRMAICPQVDAPRMVNAAATQQAQAISEAEPNCAVSFVSNADLRSAKRGGYFGGRAGRPHSPLLRCGWQRFCHPPPACRPASDMWLVVATSRDIAAPDVCADGAGHTCVALRLAPQTLLRWRPRDGAPPQDTLWFLRRYAPSTAVRNESSLAADTLVEALLVTVRN